ncbi:Eukaryotic translation initiation factor 3 subunit C [Meyerozyma sp. JA9]|nr:Eukaryotic translation initiation factor 3 subunit C [Meyerozyma sp. JA9]
MSRFFVSGYDSESSSEEEDLLTSSEEELMSSEQESDSEFDDEFANDDDSDSSDSDSDGRPSGPAYFLKSSFRKGAGGDSDSDSEDEGRRVVKSAREKLTDDMKDAVEAVNSAKRQENWITALTEFERLGRLLVRAGQQGFGTPNFYIKCLVDLEAYLVESTANEKESTRKMNANLARAFTSLKQRVKKQVKEFSHLVELYKSEPELFDKEEPVETIEKDAEIQATPLASSTGRVLSPVFATLKSVAETRGKKNIDKFEQVQILEDLLEEVLPKGSPFEIISIYQMLLSIRFDASSHHAFMPLDQWQKNKDTLNDFLDFLEKHSNEYSVSELGTASDDIDLEPPANADGIRILPGSVTSHIERLDDEFIRYLQNTDPHSLEYIDRLKDEKDTYNLVVRGQLYVERTTPGEVRGTYQGEQLARIVMRRMNHIYYKPDQLIKANESEAWRHLSGDSQIVTKNSEPKDVINGLAEFLSKQDGAIYPKGALLCSVYYHAVNNEYSVARDMFLSSQVHQGINNADSTIQVLYNRAMVQLGLSAFRYGNIEESHQALNEIANSQRLKELLGQGFNSKYPSQATVAEKQRLLPFHMHINLELLECVFMTCSLLIEIPQLAAASNSPKESRRKTNIKSFKSKLEFHDRQYFTGPPESIKDHIVHASISLQKGDWHNAYKLLSSIKIWKLLPNNDQLLEMMRGKLQVEGLRTYIFTYKSIYTKLSVVKLAKIFDINEEEVLSIVDKMISSGDVSASLSDDRKSINFVSSEHLQRTRLQELAIVMNEKIGLLTDKNEKTASNGHGRKTTQQQQQQQQKEQREQTHDENIKFRYANVNTNNDEFQTIA